MTVVAKDVKKMMPDDKLVISFKLFRLNEDNDSTSISKIQSGYDSMHETLALNDFANLFKEPKFSDVSIICAGESLKAHKSILAGSNNNTIHCSLKRSAFTNLIEHKEECGGVRNM